MDPLLISTIILAIWGALAPILCVRYGHELAKRSQQEHWINDNAKEEYRELLSALFDASNTAVLHRGLGRETTVDEDSLEERTDHHLYSKLHTRLFISNFIERENIMERWSAAFTEYSKSQNLEAFRKSLRALIETVVDHATRLRT